MVCTLVILALGRWRWKDQKDSRLAWATCLSQANGTKQNQNVDKSNHLPTDEWENKLQLSLMIGHCLAIRSRSVSVIPALRRLAREIGILRPTWATQQHLVSEQKLK